MELFELRLKKSRISLGQASWRPEAESAAQAGCRVLAGPGQGRVERVNIKVMLGRQFRAVEGFG